MNTWKAEAVARIAALVQDLLLASRVGASLEAAGHEVEQDSDVPDELDGIDLLVADLDAVPPERLQDLGVPVIGFYSHTDVDPKQRAERAGLTMAVPRSRMARELPDLVSQTLG
jgi:acetylornithine deacetylase/succinyl-diaminopimelate desuccinylase-like protein